MERRISPEEARLGMYICGFGGSWFDHPFWRVRFVLRKDSDLERLQQSGVPYVVIDDALGIGPVEPEPEAAPSPAAARPPRKMAAPRRLAEPAPRPAPAGDYGAAQQAAERRQAIALVSRSKKVMRYVFEGARLGRAVKVAEVLDVVDDITRSVERAPRTLLDVIRLKNRDEYTYFHSVAVCTLMVNFARHLGLGEEETRELGLAGLLHDIGKMSIPDEVLNKPDRLTDEEFAVVRAHPERGYKMLSETPEVSAAALDVCRHHHEKMDGRGYPYGLAAEDISRAARMGAICDVYDALTSDRIYKAAWHPSEALAAMWGWEDQFDRALLFAFMQSLAVFPEGMLVRMRSNRLAIVLKSKRRNARTRVLCFYNTCEGSFIPAEETVLGPGLASDSIVAPATPEEWGLRDWEAMAARLLGSDAVPLVA
ncbi:conserved hypothetical protein [Altererythrobacter sp. B11]|uniref:HD-GYP domain-containing protein n=1 Tax=Altererythrobacter sp. B11 TaxID=2060312 RepID=UPI000DC6FACF|nr:HD-GYP domain-containing protein [Altererythrobacter sp. B11]BBC71841.1 conserved hypothetical protein [Altererythrobacter sp. B11]